MTEDQLWKQFTPFDQPLFLPDADGFFYARDYKSHGGFQASEGNGLISNIKKKAHLKGQPQWHYKTTAIRQFARELTVLLAPGAHVCALVTSKTKDHEQYDSRLGDVLSSLQQQRADVTVHEPFSRMRSKPPQHESEDRQQIEEIYADLQWNGFDEDAPEAIVMVDDVVTTGRTYVACRRILHENCPGIVTYGVFWARTVWDD